MTSLSKYFLVCTVLVCCGCVSNLKVHKVPLEKRYCDDDHNIEGYRYYLSRPYIVVKKPILISEERHLVIGYHGPVDEATPHENRFAGKRVILSGSTEASQSEIQPALDLLSRQADSLASGTPGGAFDTVPSEAGMHLEVPKIPDDANPVKDTVSLKGDIQVIFLPDMEEQYAIEDVNCLAKNAYAIKFKDGWELTDVGAEHDSTTVAIELLNTVDSAVNAAKSIALGGITRSANIATEALKTPVGGGAFDERDGEKVYHRVVRTYIKPGIYRINKPWEIQDVVPADGCGFLQKLGLSLVVEEQVVEAEEVELPKADD